MRQLRMADHSAIEWTEATWNPVTGCTKISAGCKNCYAERMSMRLQAMGKAHYAGGFKLALHDDALTIPFRWRAPRLIFVNSMSDLFQQDVPLAFIKQVFEVMTACPQHTFQILTKRPHLAAQYASCLNWPDNVWLGTSIENADVLDRLADLRRVPAAVRFLSVEPLLGPIPRLALADIHWVIVGGESGPGARPMQAEWVRQIRDRCVVRGVPFFFKQWGGPNKKKTGRKLDGRYWNELPDRKVQSPSYVHQHARSVGALGS
jgi:protein gp37